MSLVDISIETIPKKILAVAEQHPVILFDGFCMLCNRSIQQLLKRDKDNLFRYSPLQEHLEEENQSFDSVLLIYKNRVYDRSSAVLQIMSLLGMPYSLFSIFRIVPSSVRDRVYNWVARNRIRWFGQSESCYIPSEKEGSVFI